MPLLAQQLLPHTATHCNTHCNTLPHTLIPKVLLGRTYACICSPSNFFHTGGKTNLAHDFLMTLPSRLERGAAKKSQNSEFSDSELSHGTYICAMTHSYVLHQQLTPFDGDETFFFLFPALVSCFALPKYLEIQLGRCGFGEDSYHPPSCRSFSTQSHQI